MTEIETARTYNPGDVIYEKGEAATHLYLVQAGSTVATVSGTPVTVGTGQLIGDGAMVSGAYKVTMTAGPHGCTLLPMAFDHLKIEIGRSPPLVQLLISNLLGRFEIATKLLDQQ